MSQISEQILAKFIEEEKAFAKERKKGASYYFFLN